MMKLVGTLAELMVKSAPSLYCKSNDMLMVPIKFKMTDVGTQEDFSRLDMELYPVHCLNTKSSTKTELVAIDNKLGDIL
jgi:hypothetical protein